MASRYQEQHPIPQNISSYQFRLVGDMTLKQFFQVAGGALVAILLYSSSLATFIRWPLMFVSFLFGVALAFFPLEDRPLEKWIVLFFKAIYSPTQFKWVKAKRTDFFASESSAVATPIPQQETPPQSNTASTAPVGIHQEATTAQNDLETEEQQFLSTITQQMGGATSSVQTQTIPSAVPAATNHSSQIQNQVINNVPQSQSQQSVPAPQFDTDVQSGVEHISVRTTPLEKSTEVTTPADSVNMKGQNNQTPEIKSPTILQDSSPMQTVTEQIPTHEEITVSTSASVQFSPDVAAPVAPTRENLVVGQVMDPNNHVLENAILEIRDENGRPARALKTNKLGHFGIVTPLTEGTYKITTEKDGFLFEPLTISVKNSIIQPLAIRATGVDTQ